jgi:hypothetical protein
MPLLPFGAWLPDTTDYESQTTRTAQNVIPRGDGYGPFPSSSSYSQTLPGVCRGAFYALKSDGTIVTFAGTTTKLYLLNNTDFSWSDVSRSGGTYGLLGSTAHWQFVQTGNLVFATQANDVLQVYDLSAPSTFVNALGSPPQAAYISVVSRFLVLSGISTQPFRVQWSGLNNFNASTSWDNLTLGSNYQDLPDGGVVRGVAGGDQTGIICQDQAFRSLAYVPGAPYTFQIERIAQGLGLYAPYSLVRAGMSTFLYTTQGFMRIDPGGLPTPIGRERVDRYFTGDFDSSSPQLVIGASDPRTTRVYWAYKSQSGHTGLYDKILGYDIALDRWFTVNTFGEYLVGISQTGITLEGLDKTAPTPLTITGAANNGSGAIRLTLSAESAGTPPYAGYSILGQPAIVVYGVTGTTEANGTWKFTVVDSTHIDLIGSTFTHTYVSGGQIGGSLDALILSFDAYPASVQPEIAQFDGTNSLSFFRGANLKATLESGEQGTDENKITIRGFRPITDARTLYGSASFRENLLSAQTAGTEVPINTRTGRVDLRRDTRYSRFKVRIPAGSTWTFCSGVIPDIVTGGKL